MCSESEFGRGKKLVLKHSAKEVVLQKNVSPSLGVHQSQNFETSESDKYCNPANFSKLISFVMGDLRITSSRRRGRESICKACLGACLGGIAFCGQFLCFAFQSFRYRSAVFLDKVLHKKRSLSACLGARLVPLDIISISVYRLPLSSGPILKKCVKI